MDYPVQLPAVSEGKPHEADAKKVEPVRLVHARFI